MTIVVFTEKYGDEIVTATEERRARQTGGEAVLSSRSLYRQWERLSDDLDILLILAFLGLLLNMKKNTVSCSVIVQIMNKNMNVLFYMHSKFLLCIASGIELEVHAMNKNIHVPNSFPYVISVVHIVV